MPIDPSVFDKLKTFDDYNKADQAFQLQKAAQAQALQTGSIENQAKQLSLAGQIVGNSATDQPSYDRARQVAQSQGIDTSYLPDQYNPDVVSRLRFAGATPTAQLTALIASQGHQLKAGIASGDVGAYGYVNGNNSGIGAAAPGTPTAAPQSSPLPSASPPPMSAPNAAAMSDLYSDDPPAKPVVLQGDNSLAPPAQSANTPKFSFRGQKPGETTDAYKSAQEQAFQQFKTNNAAAIKTAENSAGKKGDQIGDASKTLDIMQSNLPTVLERFQNMRKAADDANYGYGVNEEGTGFKQSFNNQFDTGTGDANQKLKQFAAQGILPELGPQLAQAGIRGNKFLETLASSASGLDLAASPKAKNDLIDGLENTYIRNLKSTAAQLRANGQSAISDADIDAQVAKLKSSPVQTNGPDNSGIKFLGFK